MDYKSAGVDLSASDAAKQKIAELAHHTHTPNVLHGPGLFGGFYQFPRQDYHLPVLVASTDGVGTKVKLACQQQSYRGLGWDIVNHCVNDLMVGGADPLFFLDYLAFGKLAPTVVTEVVGGMAAACQEAGCALLGGETAEMPDLYQAGEFDLAGTIVGVVEKAGIITGENINAGDVLIGVASSGLHTNGYTLARKIIASNPALAGDVYRAELGDTVAAVLLQPHRSYRKIIAGLRRHEGVHGFAHVTGGGIVGNTKRLLRPRLGLAVDWQAWDWPPIFKLLQQYGDVPAEEMRRVFNLGIGLVIIVRPESVAFVQNYLQTAGEPNWIIGEVTLAP
ncbi:MAG: phosphoribosylformylglycinamidine cyclo-ligase [candidate division KSB1 bacterium]|nr:phosphoribosylformylglycinamidine cyclo-ligase [candidate division KSB1 bacterium]MDZ7275492.1 phosphoribosylformylglycinamidine cyclo-ligase [candidate division KSB1 bacterium]MDZ7286196.1 phosphoribosylformylglycinamidine cyclo-ligase [candidate division KSB1 bacterium]MDZ7296422.1 phosphoribosylformylglycinamidine cyclo-ligase [candidate division KSB1 bacterium]MDZ7308952.1 phosphoribosylformylglycinamidine cyclo-ligase [candidate division KSB1 bacterium]